MSKVPVFKDDKDPTVLKTGGHIDGMVMALIETAADKEETVHDRVRQSLVDLGLQQPNLVLSSILVFFHKNKKNIPLPHRTLLLRVLRDIVNERLEKLPHDLCAMLIRLASSELTATKDLVPDWQSTSSELIVSLGGRFGKEVVDELLSKCEPATIPHFYIVKTLGNFASSHAALMVPCLNDVFSRLLPVLGMIKQDNMKLVFSTSIGHFCESIITFVANKTDHTADNLGQRDFAGQVFTAFEVMFNVWLPNGNDPKLRMAIVEALGFMAQCLSREQFDIQLPKLVPGVLALYKKHNEHLPITAGMCMILETAVKEDTRALDPLLEQTLQTLQPMVAIPIDYGSSTSLKNHNELLRCFEILARSYSDRVVAFLIQKLENSNPANRIATLDVLKHIINSRDAELKDKKELILSGLKQVLQEPNLSVRKTFGTVVIAMASKKYLGLEGGNAMIEFVVRQCALVEDAADRKKREEEERKRRAAQSKDSDESRQRAFSELEVTSPQGLRSMCENVLHLITTTIPHMEEVLWPFLTEFLVPVQYTDAFAIVCKCLTYLASKKRAENAEDYMINFDRKVNVPRPFALIGRLLVMASHPQERQRGMHALQLLQSFSPNLRATLPDMWDDVIPKLLAYLEANADGEFDQKAWEELLLKFLARTIDKVGNEDWTVSLGEDMAKQLPLYDKLVTHKNFLLRCIGVCMKKSTNKNFIKTHLDIMFNSIDHKDQVEREGVAQGFGFAASSHLDTVIEKLQTVTKTDMVRKSSGFFGMVKDKSEIDVERLRATVMLGFGYTALYAPSNLITSRIDVSIFNIIIPQFATIRETFVRENVTRAVALICTALLPDRIDDPKFVCTRRTELLNNMLTYITAEKNTLKNQVQALAMDALTTMVHMAPVLSDADRLDAVRTCTTAIYELPENVDAELMTQTLTSLNKMLAAIIEENASISSLTSMLESLAPTIRSDQAHRRQRAVEAALYVSQQYFKFKSERLKENPEVPEDFLGFGKLIAFLAPRCTDPVVKIRQTALDAIQVLLRVSELTRAGSPDKLTSNPAIEAVTVLKERAEKSEPNAQFAVVNDLSKVLAKTLDPIELLPFVVELLEGLTDKEDAAASGACVVLNGLFRQRGAELGTDVQLLLGEIHKRLKLIKHEQTEIGTLRSLRTLATHHLKTVVTDLLAFDLPYDEVVVKIWKTLAGEEVTALPMLEHLLTVITKNQPYEEKPSKNNKKEYTREATRPPMQATSALAEVFRAEDSEALVGKLLPRIMCSLLIRIGTSNGMDGPKLPIGDTISAFKEFLIRSKADYVTKDLDEQDHWDLLSDEDEFFNGLTTVARSICVHGGEHVPAMIEFLMPFLSSPYDTQRVVTAALFAEFIYNRCAENVNLIEQLMNACLGRLIDDSHVVRKLCIRGLGNVANAPEAQIQRYSTTILSAMMAGMDDKNDIDEEITMEAMNGLSKILAKLDENHIRPILINICLRIRPCFEKQQDGVRAAAITLFGKLSRFGDGPSKAPFFEQILANFVSMLLHLNDDSVLVRTACKSALKDVGPLLGADDVNAMFQKYLLEKGSLLYPDFMSDLSKLVIDAFPEKMNFFVMGNVNFFKSDWDTIKANAALFAGFLLCQINKTARGSVTVEHVCSSLTNLLQESSPLVREKAAEAIGLLFDY
ncbi:hypothetical protein CAOG_06818 [Capsaspora owczarzaki ATCC 30864]|uniref:Uncharacterized protein n=1 Tax=Capsaspora owczarzaki (strain ATCC 30864) TaxID=595528 RepID=A0A0D2WVX2_CAPO3|nr:hypothetical protein CAOG_06818 [Capsaspora owczarzaki ATCC 30864]KJE96498.1 hypothetical protein CAOG_006818 [Capsaspora owczarzaki ATCC 30864]|eukprot:XP_004344439.1 hypothetical protein CAOG_06818 [Capsaspora owczarzaki ATCC 30864]